MEGIYEKLRARLDDLATGYPATESKIEIRLLQRLFTEEEAELFLQLSPLLQKPEGVAQQLNRDPNVISALMEHMAPTPMGTASSRPLRRPLAAPFSPLKRRF